MARKKDKPVKPSKTRDRRSDELKEEELSQAVGGSGKHETPSEKPARKKALIDPSDLDSYGVVDNGPKPLKHVKYEEYDTL